MLTFLSLISKLRGFIWLSGDAKGSGFFPLGFHAGFSSLFHLLSLSLVQCVGISSAVTPLGTVRSTHLFYLLAKGYFLAHNKI